MQQGVGQLRICCLLRQQQVLPHSAPGQQARLLEHGADARYHRTTPIDGSAKIGVQAADDPQEGRFAAAGRSDQRDDFAPTQRDIDLAQHRQFAETLVEGFALDVQPQDQLRHRVARRSIGCRTAHSIICTTRMKANV